MEDLACLGEELEQAAEVVLADAYACVPDREVDGVSHLGVVFLGQQWPSTCSLLRLLILCLVAATLRLHRWGEAMCNDSRIFLGEANYRREVPATQKT